MLFVATNIPEIFNFQEIMLYATRFAPRLQEYGRTDREKNSPVLTGCRSWIFESNTP